MVQTFAEHGVWHDQYAELRRDPDGYIVQVGCRTCNRVQGFMHPRAALEIAGRDSKIGREILEIFPEWAAAVENKTADVLK